MSELKDISLQVEEVVKKGRATIDRLIAERKSKETAASSFRQATEANRVLRTLRGEDGNFSPQEYRAGTIFYIRYTFIYPNSKEASHEVGWYVIGDQVDGLPTVYKVAFKTPEGLESAYEERLLPDTPFELVEVDRRAEDAGIPIANAHNILSGREPWMLETYNYQTDKLVVIAPGAPPKRGIRRPYKLEIMPHIANPLAMSQLVPKPIPAQ